MIHNIAKTCIFKKILIIIVLSFGLSSESYIYSQHTLKEPPKKPKDKIDKKPSAEELCHLGMQYHEKKDYKNSFQYFIAAAEKGNTLAIYNLAYCYENGLGTDPNMLEAAIHYRTAAENGLPEAQHMLAGCYNDGIGLQKNPQKARYWYEKAADQNYGLSQYALAENFLWPCKQNTWCPLDSLKSFADYYNGMEMDYYKYIKAAYENGIEKAAYGLGRCYLMIPSISDDIRGLALINKAISNNDTSAMIYMSDLYRKGIFVKQQSNESKYLIMQAALQDNFEAISLYPQILASYRQYPYPSKRKMELVAYRYHIILYLEGRRSTKLSKNAYRQIEIIANKLLKNPEHTVTILVYTPHDGAMDENIKLADERANDIKDILITKYNIPQSRISILRGGIQHEFEEVCGMTECFIEGLTYPSN